MERCREITYAAPYAGFQSLVVVLIAPFKSVAARFQGKNAEITNLYQRELRILLSVFIAKDYSDRGTVR